jgi:hypothetical protein
MDMSGWVKAGVIIGAFGVIVHIVFGLYDRLSPKITPTPTPIPTKLPILGPTLTPAPTLIEGIIDFTLSPYFLVLIFGVMLLLFAINSATERK